MRMAARHVSTLALATACLATAAASAAAQAKGGGFSPGYTDIGAVVGIGGLNGASASFGGRFEHAIKSLPDLGNGTLSIQAGAEWYSWSYNPVPGYSWSVSYIPIFGTLNYHFKLDDPKWDPFIGAGLGYYIVNCSSSGVGFNGACSFSSSLYFVGRAGGRYFFNPKMALYADVGAGGAAVNVGLTFKLQ
jgi:hypothetical protein